MWGNGRNDNAWMQIDRQERRKTIATVVIFFVVTVWGIGLMAFGLLGS